MLLILQKGQSLKSRNIENKANAFKLISKIHISLQPTLLQSSLVELVDMAWDVSVSVTVSTRQAVLSTVEVVRLAVLLVILGKIVQVGPILNFILLFPTKTQKSQR